MIGTIFSLLRYLNVFKWAGIILGAIGLYGKGRADARNKQKQKNLKDEVETHEKITDAERNITDGRSARSFLRNRAKRRGS